MWEVCFLNGQLIDPAHTVEDVWIESWGWCDSFVYCLKHYVDPIVLLGYYSLVLH